MKRNLEFQRRFDGESRRADADMVDETLRSDFSLVHSAFSALADVLDRRNELLPGSLDTIVARARDRYRALAFIAAAAVFLASAGWMIVARVCELATLFGELALIF